jgi:DNA polymerase (family 10)
MKGLPLAMFELMEVPGIGAKTAFKLVTELGIKSLDELAKAAKQGKIRGIEGFGEKSEAEIVKSIEDTKGRTKRLLLPYATEIADSVIAWLKKNKAIKRADPLGSLRRKTSTIGDIDVSAASDNPREAIEHFTSYPKKTRVLEKGDTTASIILPGDVQVDLMVQTPNAYGALLQHFTGSKHHNVALREYALKKGMSLSEYGIKNIRKKESRRFRTEEDFYKYLGLDWISPELREDTGEIEAAREYKLPKLVKLADIKTDLQIHSSFNVETSHDLGISSMEEIIEEAGRLGYEYLAFTEHNPSRSGHTEKQIVDILKHKSEAVEKINYSLVKSMKKRVRKVFNSLEIDIKQEGGLPVPEEAMETLDFALVAIHGSFRLDRDTMTRRVLSALEHPKVKIFAHPTARKLNEREGIELNWPEIFDYCVKNKKWLEINADPMRLDLPDNLVKEAVKAGVKLTLGTDAHSKEGLRNMVYGVSVARRGWATKEDIINTRTLVEFEKLLKEGD